MKNIESKKLYWGLFLLVLFFAPSFAFAQEAQFENVSLILQNKIVQGIITFGLAVMAVWKVVEFVQNFSFSSAWKDVWIPAFFIFATLQWQTMLSWFGISV